MTACFSGAWPIASGRRCIHSIHGAYIGRAGIRVAGVAAVPAPRAPAPQTTDVAFGSGAKGASKLRRKYERFTLQLEEGERPPQAACADVLKSLAERGHHAQALELFGRLTAADSYKLSLQAHYRLIWAAIKERDARALVRVFESQLATHGFASNAVWAAFLGGLLRCNTRGLATQQLAYEYWVRLKACGQRLDRRAILAGMSACIEAGRPREAERILGAMRDYGVPPDTAAHNVLLKAAARAGDVDAARRLFRSMRAYGYGPSLVTYNTLMQAFVQAGQPLRARAVLDKARREGCPPDVVSYTTLMRGLARARQPAAAEALLAEMAREGVAPNLVTYSVLIDGYARAADPGSALRLAADAEAAGIRLTRPMYNCLVQAYCKVGLLESSAEVAAVLERMAAAGARPGADTYTTILQALTQGPSPDFSAAAALLEAMVAGGLAPDVATLTCLMKLQAAAGQPDAALRCFDEMLSLARRAPGLPPLAGALAVGDGGAAADGSSGAGSSGGSSSSSSNGSLKSSSSSGSDSGNGDFASRGIALGSFDEQLQAAEGWGDGSTANSSCSSSPPPQQQQRGSGGSGGDAAAAAASLPGPLYGGPDVVAWNALVDVLAECGRLREAAAALERAVEAAQALARPPPQEAFGAMIKGYGRAGQKPEAVTALRRCLQLGGRPARHTCDLVISLCLAEGDVRTASQVVRAMELTGQPVDRAYYRGWFDRAQAALASGGSVAAARYEPCAGGQAWQRYSQQRGGAPDGPDQADGVDRNVGFERLKWFFGLPNRYYEQQSARLNGSAGAGPGGSEQQQADAASRPESDDSMQSLGL